MTSEATRHHGCDALVVAKTPLQILNGAEACEHFGLRRPALRLLTSRKFTPGFMLSLVDPADWESVACFDRDPIRHRWRLPLVGDRARDQLTELRWVLQLWQHRRSFDAYFRPWRGIENLVLGNYHQEFFVHLAARCRARRCILVDDGTDTFHVAAHRRRRAAGETVVAPRPSFRRSPKQWWVAREVAWRPDPLDHLVFFSTYDLDLPAGDTLEPNRYGRARRRAGRAAGTGPALFLGQPLVEDGYLEPAVFRRLLIAVRESFGDLPLAYVPHPREDRDALEATLAACELPLQEISKPFEFHLMEADTLPSAVASFFSSALDNCRLIWDDRMRLIAFRLPREELLVGHDFVDEVYGYFADRGDGAIRIHEPGHPLT